MFGTDSMFQAMSVAGPVFFLVVAGIILAVAVAGIRQWARNNNSPVLSVEARLVNTREDVSDHFDRVGDDSMMHQTSTSYYATFQVESGDRIEFHVSGREYGLLAQGDVGKLTFQGTRYLSFQRR